MFGRSGRRGTGPRGTWTASGASLAPVNGAGYRRAVGVPDHRRGPRTRTSPGFNPAGENSNAETHQGPCLLDRLLRGRPPRRWSRRHPPSPGPPPEPPLLARGGARGDDGARGVRRRAGRQRARDRQPDRHDLRRPGAHLGHREPRISPQGGGPGAGPRQGPGGHRPRRPGGQVHRVRRRAEHPDGHRRRLRGGLGPQRPRPPVPAGYRRRRQGGPDRGRRHRLRSCRRARAAQHADLGTRRLALRAQRRLQPEPDQVRGPGVSLHLRDVAGPSPHARVPGGLRGDEQPLRDRLGPRGERHRRGVPLGERPPVPLRRDRLLQAAGGGLPALHDADRLDHRPRAPEDRLLRARLLRQRRLSRGVSRPALHGQHPRRLHQRRRAVPRRLDLRRPRPSPTS